jgi:hypothetical protein
MLAVPPVTVTGLPMSVGVPVPYSNCTVPGADGLTVAVSVTEVPETWGLAGNALRDVVVLVNVGVGYTTVQVLPLTWISAES